MAEIYRGARILIVDDEDANVILLERMLGRAGYENLTSIRDSRQFTEIFKETQPDLLLLDLLMPYVDGYEILKQLPESIQPETYLPVLVLTADVSPQALERALVGGAKDFLTKPFAQTELLLRVGNLLETRFLYLGLQRQVETLEQLYEAAAQSILLRDESLSMVSHDINQPLTALRLTAEALQEQMRGAKTPAPQELSKDLETINAASHQMAAMISELADTASLQMGRHLALRIQPVDLVRLAAQQIAAIQKSTRRHRIRLDAPVHELVGEWDEMRIARVLSNLLTNAVKFSPKGGNIVVRIDAVAEANERQAHLSVSDQGLGIPEDDLPHVFERFYRAANTGHKAEGRGVGLASARQIVEQHRGTIHVETQLGKGSTFTVVLPLAPAP